ncbi:MAG TPA: AAA family ATPase [Acidimicrobiia bacterium]|nr:AAA family ATPase [Acidimicrobiia bacterium]
MAIECTSCAAQAPSGSRFCPLCGSAISAGPGRERKFATALFADLVGSTALGDREDAEVVQELVARVFDRLAPVIERYGGLIDNYMGDGILAIFGVPQIHEDDPDRAVRSGLEMQDVLSELNRSFAAEGRPQVQIRIGLEAGEVLVDSLRPDRRVTGDTVNLAARLQGAAEPGTVVVGPAAHALTHRIIGYEALSPLDVKGKPEKVPAWRATGVAARLRGERPSTGLGSQLVGRDDELAILRQVFDRSVREGTPGLITILGPAGTGKSRLVREFARELAGGDVVAHWREGRCLAYGNVSYSALADSVKAHCELLEDDSSDRVRAKVRRAVTDLFPEGGPLEEVLALVGAGTGVELSREELFEGWRQLLERLAGRRPLVMVWEDIHWADSGLMDFIEHAADWAQGPILMLTMARPELLESRPTWGAGLRNYTSVHLDPLTAAESRRLVDDLAGGALPDALADQIVQHSEGNPFYTEEIVQMLIDRGSLERADGALRLVGSLSSVDVPRSVQSLLAARIDGLGPDEKATLQDAAVVGRAVWVGAVASLGKRAPHETSRLLGELQTRDLLLAAESSTFSGDEEFWFRHILIKDVAYESIPKRERARKHQAAAEWAEERVGDRSHEQAELIATHHRQALGYLDELRADPAESAGIRSRLHVWAERAAHRAESLGQLEEAAKWYRVAVEAAGPEIDGLDIARLWEAYARGGAQNEPVDRVIAALENALDLYEGLHLDLDAGRVEARLGFAVWESGNDPGGEGWLDKSVARLQDLEPSSELAEALTLRGNFRWRHNLGHDAEQDLRRAIELADRTGADIVSIEAQHDLGIALTMQERPEEAMALIKSSYEAAQRSSDIFLRVRSGNNWGVYLYNYFSELDEAVEVLRTCLAETRRTGSYGFTAWGAVNLSAILRRQGKLDEADEVTQISLDALAKTDTPLLRGWSLAGIAETNLWRGDVRAARRILDTAQLRLDDPETHREVARLLIELARSEGRTDDALGTARVALEILPEQFFPGTDHQEFGLEVVRMLMATGERDEAASVRARMRAGFEPRRAADACLQVADALLASRPDERADHLRDAVEVFEDRGFVIAHLRALIDLADALVITGDDPTAVVEEARRIGGAIGAGLYLTQLEERFPA